VLLSLHIWLPSLDPARLSNDLSFHARVLRGLQGASVDLSADTRSAMGGSLGLIIHGLQEPIDDPVSTYHKGGRLFSRPIVKGAPTSTLRELDRLLHPRIPLLARAPPNSELLSLFRTEESVEEQEIREGLHLGVVPSAGRTEIMGGKHQTSMPSARLPLPPKSETGPNVNKPKTLALVPSSLTYPQATTPDLRPNITSTPISNVSPPTRNLSQGPSDSSDTLRPQQEQGIHPSLMSGVVSAPPEESRLGTVSEVINVVEDDDDDEEMPTIDMESDSD